MFDLRTHNRTAEIAAARRVEWQVWLTGKPVPRHWFPDLRNCRDSDGHPLVPYMTTHFATKAIKP